MSSRKILIEAKLSYTEDGGRGREVSTKYRSISTTLHGVTSQNTAFFSHGRENLKNERSKTIPVEA
jgi:hypothetical protein